MRETQFISQNKENWREFEEELKKKEKDPDKLSRLFTEITDDLSYSRSFYPNRSVRYYLNSLAQRLYLNIYKNRKQTGNAFLKFWTEELPAIIYHSRKDFYISFAFFFLAVLIGVFCSTQDPDFVRQILGDSYVDMTLENIKNGDPMAVYKQTGELKMSLGITFNNLYVSFRTFALGILMGIGTLASLLYNGIMLGAFQYFMIEQGVVKESLLTIWQHGTLEIPAIVIAGAAGISVGRGWLFPGTYSRLQAFKYSALRGMKIFIGVAPIILMAGFIEGFITRHTEFPDAIRIMVILLSLAIIIGYYLVIPFRTSQAVRKQYEFEGLNDSPQFFSPETDKIHSTGEIFTHTFQLFQKVSGKAISISFWIAISYGILLFICSMFIDFSFSELSFRVNSSNAINSIIYLFTNGITNLFLTLGNFFNYSDYPLLFPLNTIVFTLITWTTLKQLKLQYFTNKNKKPDFKLLGYIFGVFAIINIIFFIPYGLAFFLVLLLFPFIWLFAQSISFEDNSISQSLKSTFELFKGTFSQLMSVSLSLFFFGMFAYLLVSSPFSYIVMEFLNWNLPFEETTKRTIFQIGIVIVSMFGIMLTSAFLITGFSLLFFTLKEINSARGIKIQIDQIGQKNRLNGLAKESDS